MKRAHRDGWAGIRHLSAVDIQHPASELVFPIRGLLSACDPDGECDVILRSVFWLAQAGRVSNLTCLLPGLELGVSWTHPTAGSDQGDELVRSRRLKDAALLMKR